MKHNKTWPESLVERNILSSETLSYAQYLAHIHLTSLEEILVRYGYLNYKTLYHHIAHISGLAYADLFLDPVDTSIVDNDALPFYNMHNLIPWKIKEGTTLLAISSLNCEAEAWAKEHYTHFTFVITSPRDIARSIKQVGRSEDLLYIQDRLLTFHSNYSCKTICFNINYYKTLCGLALLITLLFHYGYFIVPVYLFLNLLCIFNNFFKFFLSLVGSYIKDVKSVASPCV